VNDSILPLLLVAQSHRLVCFDHHPNSHPALCATAAASDVRAYLKSARYVRKPIGIFSHPQWPLSFTAPPLVTYNILVTTISEVEMGSSVQE
jgi:hypothetical protein